MLVPFGVPVAMLKGDATGRLGPSFMFVSLIGRRRLPRRGEPKRRCTAIAGHPGERCPDRVPGRDFRPPKYRLAGRSPGPIASGTGGLAGEAAARRSGDQFREFSRMLARPTPARHAAAHESGLLRFLRTSLTSTFRVSRRVGEREGKRSARCDRLPSRSRRCRARISILVAALARLPAELLPPRGYCPSGSPQIKSAHLTDRGPRERCAHKHRIQASQGNPLCVPKTPAVLIT